MAMFFCHREVGTLAFNPSPPGCAAETGAGAGHGALDETNTVPWGRKEPRTVEAGERSADALRAKTKHGETDPGSKKEDHVRTKAQSRAWEKFIRAINELTEVGATCTSAWSSPKPTPALPFPKS